jgi:hypothetical protein
VILQTILDEVKVAGKAFDLTHTEV